MIFIRFHKGYAIYWICCFVRSPPPLFWELTPTPRAPSKSPSYCINGFQCSVTLFLIYGWLVKGWAPKLHWANPSPSLRIWIWALFKKSCFFPVQLLDIKPRAVVFPTTRSGEVEEPDLWSKRKWSTFSEMHLWLGLFLFSWLRSNCIFVHWCHESPQYLRY